MDFPGGSDGKLSVYNARDLDLIPGENEYEMPRNLLDSSCRYCVQSLQSCLTLCDPMDYSPPGSSVHGDSSGKNTGEGCRALLRGSFPTQGWERCLLCLLHLQVGSNA